MQFSQQQRAVIDAAGHITVNASAGTGKSTTLSARIQRIVQDAIERDDPMPRILATSFSKNAVLELRAKIPYGMAVIESLHAIGWAWCRGAFPGVILDKSKGREIARRVCFDRGFTRAAKRGAITDPQWSRAVHQTASFAKSALSASEEDLRMIIRKHGFDLGLKEVNRQRGDVTTVLVTLAIQALEEMYADTRRMDMDDMIWFPVKYNLYPDLQFDHVVIDEAQNTSPAQLWIAQRALDPNGSFVAVGDKKQAVYSWRSADKFAMSRLTQAFNAKELRMSRTYRCGHAITYEAKAFVSDFEADEGNPPGEVRNASFQEMINKSEPGDFIVARYNKHVMKAALALIRADKRASLRGKNYADQLRDLARMPRKQDLSVILRWLPVYREKEGNALLDDGRDEAAAMLVDRVSTLTHLVKSCADWQMLMSRLDNLFDDDVNSDAVTCMTIHRVQGAEASTVWVMDWSPPTHRQWQKYGQDLNTNVALRKRIINPEEFNLRYVAVTRAIDRLYYVGDEGFVWDLRRSRYSLPHEEPDLGYDETPQLPFPRVGDNGAVR